MTGTCINHPHREAAARCLTCHKPVCSECVVTAANGTFCSELCRANYIAYQARKADLPRPGVWEKLKSLFFRLLTAALVAGLLLFVGAKILKIGFLSRLWNRLWS